MQPSRAHRVRQVPHADSDSSALHFPGCDDLLHDRASHVDRNRKADADVAAARRNDRGVDPNQFPLKVDQSAAGITRVDRSIGLYEVLITLLTQPRSAKGANQTRRDGLAETKRVTDCNDKITDVQAIAVTEGNGLQFGRILDLK